jgi:hypothetical protein
MVAVAIASLILGLEVGRRRRALMITEAKRQHNKAEYWLETAELMADTAKEMRSESEISQAAMKDEKSNRVLDFLKKLLAKTDILAIEFRDREKASRNNVEYHKKKEKQFESLASFPWLSMPSPEPDPPQLQPLPRMVSLERLE